MLRYEWKKILFNRRGIWFIVVFLVAELLGILFYTRPYDRVLEENRAVYESYLAPVTGSLTPEKRESIEAEMERLNRVHLEMEQLKRDYYSGKVTEEEYREKFDTLVADDERFVGFSKLYTQYIFVREQPNRAFLYTGGWETLLTAQEPDYLFLLLLVILLAPVFCEEYASRMHEILLTQKKSARYQVLTKVAVALILSAALTAVLQLAELVYCAARFGLPHGEFSLQSLRSFGNAEKALTLWQAFWLQFALKELGYLYAAVWVLFLSVWFQKYALTLMAGIASLALPFLTVESNDVFLRIPAPWALSLGSIYLNGSKSHTDSQTGQTVTTVAELPFGELGLLVVCVVAIMALMLLFIRQKNTNHQLKRGKLGLLLCAGALLLSGCGETETPVIYNSTASGWCETDDYMLMNTQFSSYFIDKDADVWYPMPLDAAAEDTVSVRSNYFCAGGKIYYVRATALHPSAGIDSSLSQSYVLAQLDAQKLTETVRFQWDTERKWFFGLLDRESTQPNPFMVNTFFIHGNDLYYEDQGEGAWCRMDLTTGSWEMFLDPNGLNVAYDGENIYYTDVYNRLVIRDLNSGHETVLDDLVTEKYLLTPEGIYFLNRRDNHTLYRWDAAQSKAVKLDDTVAYELHYDGDYLWVQSRTDGNLYRMNHDGSGRTVVEAPGYLCCVGENLYFQDIDTGTLYAMDRHTLSTREVNKSK